LASQPFIAFSIVQLRFGQVVAPAIYFDDQARSVDRKVDDVPADGRLASDGQAKLAQSCPQFPFRHSHLSPTLACAFHCA
jgi:hypothetical protein